MRLILAILAMKYKKEIHPAFDDLFNFYEDYVFATIANHLVDEHEDDPGFLADVACVALNKLPCKYIRHHVDMTFYMTPDEYQQMENRVNKAVSEAVELVKSHRRSDQ
jgi:predicted Co/Zn/Cd cation transporter (cation efflux family)